HLPRHSSLSRVLCTPTASPELYPLSLHDALPICRQHVSFHDGGVRVVDERVHRDRIERLRNRGEALGIRARDAGDELEIGRSFRSEEHTSELQSRVDLVCRLLLEKKKKDNKKTNP